MSKRIWIEGREYREIAKMAEQEGWSDEQLAQYLERRYGKQKK
jgi:ribosome-binding protein aMBF1 (putative translation factor)